MRSGGGGGGLKTAHLKTCIMYTNNIVANALVCVCICRGLFFAFGSLRTCTK